MVKRDIFKKEKFWEGKSYKLQLYVFMVLLAISVFFVANYSTPSENVLQQVTGAGAIDIPEIEENVVEEEIPFLPKGEDILVGTKIFTVNKIDKEFHIRNEASNGVYYIFTFTVTSSSPYVPEIRLISGKSVLAPETEVENFYGDKVLRQVEGTTKGLRVFDVPNEFDEVLIDLDVNINSTLYRIK